jgi:hypothetical protein
MRRISKDLLELGLINCEDAESLQAAVKHPHTEKREKRVRSQEEISENLSGNLKP